MIALIHGTVIERGNNTVLVQTNGGVGYELRVQHSFSCFPGDIITLHTYLKVSESAMELYGFETTDERSFFVLLLSVKGIGPKSALNILSLGSLPEVKNAIGRGDSAYLIAVQGMGKKTAERLVVELKSKVGQGRDEPSTAFDSGVLRDVIDGLVAMGYSKDEARRVSHDCDTEGKTVEEVLRQAFAPGIVVGQGIAREIDEDGQPPVARHGRKNA